MLLKILLCSFSLLILDSGSFEKNNPVMVFKVENNRKIAMLMDLEINGAIKLYSFLEEEYMPIFIGDNQTVNRKVINKSYCIGVTDEVEVITPRNLKKMAKKYFKDAPALQKNIGKHGFRFENLPFMILFYNKLMEKGEPLTKEDVKDWTIIE